MACSVGSGPSREQAAGQTSANFAIFMMTLNAYYFRHHLYTLVPHTLVPRHVRDDMAWMRDIGTDIVSLAILEQDLYAARHNVDIICSEAERAGMRVYAVPSRWGGLVAGAPKVPSFFAATHPETWILKPDGAPAFSQVSGPMCSVHHEATREFFRERLSVLLGQWPIAGIVWDEPKTPGLRDFSASALQKLGPDAPLEAHTDAVASFFDEAGRHAREVSPQARLGMFLPCNAAPEILERCARLESLHDFGCNGRPWRILAHPGASRTAARWRPRTRCCSEWASDFCRRRGGTASAACGSSRTTT